MFSICFDFKPIFNFEQAYFNTIPSVHYFLWVFFAALKHFRNLILLNGCYRKVFSTYITILQISFFLESFNYYYFIHYEKHAIKQILRGVDLNFVNFVVLIYSANAGHIYHFRPTPRNNQNRAVQITNCWFYEIYN